MNSYAAKLLIITPPARPDDDPQKEFKVDGVVEWDDASFSIRRATGELLFQIDTKHVYRHIDIFDLHAPDPQLTLNAPSVNLEIEITRKHRQQALAALRTLVQAGAASDPDFRKRLEGDARTQLRRGSGCLTFSVAGLLVGGTLLHFGKGGGDFFYFVMFGLALGVAVGAWLIYAARKQRRVAGLHP